MRTYLLDSLIENITDTADTATTAWSWLTSIHNYPYPFKFSRSYAVDRDQGSSLRTRELVLKSSLVDAYRWCAKHFGTDSKRLHSSYDIISYDMLYVASTRLMLY